MLRHRIPRIVLAYALQMLSKSTPEASPSVTDVETMYDTKGGYRKMLEASADLSIGCKSSEVDIVYRRVAEVFGRVFVLTGIFSGVIKFGIYECRRREPLGGLGACPPRIF